MTVQRFRIRQASFSDFKDLLEFYQRNRSTALPMETAKTVGDAIEAGRVLIVRPLSRPEIVATGSLFQLTPQASLTYVSEMAGMRVTKALGGAGPVTVQMMLIGLRLIGHAALEREPILQGATNSIIAAVHKDNAASVANLEAVAMRPLQPPFPDWFTYNQIGWYGTAINGEWRYYYADNQTVVRSLELLDGVGLFSGTITLQRKNRDTNETEVFEFQLALNDLQDAAEDLKAILGRTARVALVPPPQSLVFHA